MDKVVRVGGASGFWGDSAIATPQLLNAPLNYLVYDYLAETTLPIMARARSEDPQMGYATDFVSMTVAQNLQTIVTKRVKVLSNVGGSTRPHVERRFDKSQPRREYHSKLRSSPATRAMTAISAFSRVRPNFGPGYVKI